MNTVQSTSNTRIMWTAVALALIAMIIGQILAGVPVDVVVSTILVIISLSGMILGIVTLRNIRD